MIGRWVDLGRLSYGDAYQIQLEVLESVQSGSAPDTLLLVEHYPVLTLGANFHPENLLLSRERYADLGIDVCPIDRGGDVTYHGPGQLVIYPIFDLNRYGKDLHRWLRDLEECIILAVGDLGLQGQRFPPHTGVWIGERKVAAIGIKVKRWVSMHGIALNCAATANAFEHIVPCGIREYGVTSLSEELGRSVSVDDMKPRIRSAFERVFGLELES